MTLAWLIPYEFSPLFIAVVVLAAYLYGRGALTVHVSGVRQLGFWLGLALIYFAMQTQFDYYAEHQFFIHRIQHTILHHIAPFLIVLSSPLQTLAASTPKSLKQRAFVLYRQRAVRKAIALFMHPAVQVILFCGIIVFWLIPPVHFIAMLDWRYYRLMNAGMAVNGLIFWGLALSPYRSWSRKFGPGWRIGMMLAVIPPQIITGALLFLVPYDFYPIYSLCGRAVSGISPLADQQIGGLILWVPAAMMSVLGIVIVVYRTLAGRT